MHDSGVVQGLLLPMTEEVSTSTRSWTLRPRAGVVGIVSCAVVLMAEVSAAATRTVEVGPNGELVFSPSSVTVNTGDTVEWKWGMGLHSTTRLQGPETWDSGVVNAPHTFSHTFMQPGVYDYFCSVHQALGMTGTVTVHPAALPTTTMPRTTSTTSAEPVSGSCTSIQACETALTAALPTPMAMTGKSRRVARFLQRLATRADHQLTLATAQSGARQAHLIEKANRTLERLRSAADKAESRGTLGVPVGPIDADVGSLVSLDASM
jgi:plastocyanin